ncbi:MAG: hypothetical protein JW812_00325 [Alphaproteobacteria bacterium]|nr:hypothetical protein [Alphaproteobacteria bacterium]MBN2779617.1 hypothetical protein [Alphaproteobacteria bacterium]
MKRILAVFLSLFIITPIWANNIVITNLQNQKTELVSINQNLKEKQESLIKERDSLKKKRNLWATTTAVTGVAAITTVTGAVVSNKNKKDIEKKIEDIQFYRKHPGINKTEDAEKIVFTIKSKNVHFDTSIGAGNLMVTGPLVHPDGSIVGGYIENGVQKKAWENPKDSKFLVDPKDVTKGYKNFGKKNAIIGQKIDGTFFMMWHKDKATLPLTSDIAWAFQNGPYFRLTGQSDPTGGASLKRGALGYKNGEIIVVLTKKNKTFSEMSSLLAGMGIDNAIHLDSIQNGGYQYKGKKAVTVFQGLQAKNMKIIFQ